jgi:tetratricopeptide (TPR) repeat protein/two-component sensor histidine kinase
MLKALRYFLLIFLIGLTDKLFSHELDGLKADLAVLKAQKKADLYLKIGILYAEKYGQPDSVLAYAQKTEILSRKLNYTNGILNGMMYQGIAFQQKNNFDSAIAVLTRALVYKESMPIKANLHYYLGQTYDRAGDRKKAIENLIESVRLFKINQDQEGLILAYARLADEFENDTQHEEAKNYKNKAIQLLPQIKTPYIKLIALSILSSIYFDLREISSANLDTSIVFATDAFRLMKEFGYFMKANRILNSISDVYYIKEEYNNALLYCKESLKYRKFLLPGEIIMSYMKYSDCSSMLNQNETALIYLDSVKVTLNYIDVPYYWLMYFQRSYEYNRKAHKYEAAFSSIERYNALKDSIYTVDKSTAMNELIQKYNKAENEKTISALNQQREIDKLQIRSLFAFISIAILIIVIIIFLYRQSSVKNKLKIIETEQRLNRARMNPHFFFNALSSLQNIALSDTKKELVPSFISKFSKIMRQSLESTYTELDTVENEMAFLTDYLELQKLRSENRFTYTFKVEESVESNELLMPGMILQPFIENSIEHGFKNISYEGCIEISVAKSDKLLLIEVKDNGKGLRDDEKQKGYPSRATQIIKDRLFLLNKTYRTNATFALTNLDKDKGTLVQISLPVIYKT